MGGIFDVVVIGAGPAGYHAAIRANQLGANVCVVEKEDTLGGVCLNKGCIPTKALAKSAEVVETLKRSREFGIDIGNYSIDYPAIIERKTNIVKKMTQGLAGLFKSYGIDVVQGNAKVIEPQKVSIEGQVIEAKNIILATGSRPALVSPMTADGDKIITTDEALSLSKIPKSLVIVGGGYTGCEFAHIFNSLGCQVTIVEMMKNLLPGEDHEISANLALQLRKTGIRFHMKEKIETVSLDADNVLCTLTSGKEIAAQKMLVCMGRVPNIENLGLEELGIKQNNGKIVTNENMQTNIGSIYAAGDIVDSIMLAHVAFREGIVAAENIMGIDAVMDYRVIPHCIFTSPEVASVGMTEKVAGEQNNNNIKTGKFSFMPNGKALCDGEKAGFIKIVANADNDEILGVHIIGAHASNLISEGCLAVANKATLSDISELIHPHPTLSEIFMEAASDGCGTAIHLPKKIM